MNVFFLFRKNKIAKKLIFQILFRIPLYLCIEFQTILRLKTLQQRDKNICINRKKRKENEKVIYCQHLPVIR